MKYELLQSVKKYFERSRIRKKTGRTALLVFVLTGILALALYAADSQSGLPKNEKGQAYLERNSYGGGSRSEALSVEGEELGEGVVEIEIGELEYSAEEVRTILEDAAVEIETLILSDNESLEMVRSDLNLVSQIPDTGIEVDWELSDYTLMDITGKLNTEELQDGGTLLDLTAVLTYRRETVRHTFPIYVYPPELTKEEEKLADLRDAVQSAEESSRSQKQVILPEEVDGKVVIWRQPKGQRWLPVLLLGAAFAALLFVKDREVEKKLAEERKKQMMLDYPGIVNKLTIYIGAGMTIRNAWGRMVRDYEKTQRKKELRHAYEEMRITWHELGDGVGERECYERFGSRCQIQAYMKLGTMLAQNLRKGSKGLSEVLRLEAINAFEERKMTARRQGEEAGTKLLMPMFLMLAIVLVIVILPAFLSIQI